MSSKLTIKQLIKNLPQQGRVEWLSIRPERKKPVKVLSHVRVNNNGLEDDHYAGKSGNRSITIIQAEHIAAVASLLHRQEISPETLRRNIVISGINLLALKERPFKVGETILQMTGLCHPCSRMEEVLGKGGYNAMRGHGGINARVIKPGEIYLGDIVEIFKE